MIKFYPHHRIILSTLSLTCFSYILYQKYFKILCRNSLNRLYLLLFRAHGVELCDNDVQSNSTDDFVSEKTDVSANNSILDDLEDLIDSETSQAIISDEYHKKKLENEDIKRLKTNPIKIEFEQAESIKLRKEANSNIPGIQLVFVKTYGCSHNNSDSEAMMGLLNEYGYGFTNVLEESHICLINSCTVKSPSESSVITMVKKAESLGIPVVVAGCVPQAQKNIKELKYVSVIGTRQIHRVVEVVEETLKGHIVQLLQPCALPSLDIPKIRKNQYIESNPCCKHKKHISVSVIPISSGCLGSCTYCKTKHARGHLGSYELKEILKRVESVSDEVQQIWFTSEDVGAYGLDIKTDIATLLEKTLQLLENIYKTKKKNIMLRIGMTNPPFILNSIEKLGELLNHDHCFKFIHIPVQSGSNKVLYDMKREYTREEFCSLVDLLKKKVPHITIATDIICGFPTERSVDHEYTLDLLKMYQFPIVNISQFYSRPNTPAASMKKLPSQVVKNRSTEVTNFFHSYSCNDFLLDTVQHVWFSSLENTKNQMVGHTQHYIKVVTPLDTTLLGTNQLVKIIKVSKWHVEGQVLV